MPYRANIVGFQPSGWYKTDEIDDIIPSVSSTSVPQYIVLDGNPFIYKKADGTENYYYYTFWNGNVYYQP